MNKKCLWHKKNFLGFNLIQMVIIIAILAVIIGTVMYNEDPEKRIGRSRDAQRITELDAITAAIANYELEYHALPSDLSIATLGIGEKRVLCSAAAQLSCDGQTKDCVVVSDPNFLGKYLPILPVDPEKSGTTDTGYYITRSSNNTGLVVGACNTYDTSRAMEKTANAILPAYEASAPVPSCGNGVLDTGELCDYNAAGTTCGYNTDYYTQGVVYDENFCDAPVVGCSSSCNSCMNSCSIGAGGKTFPCNPAEGEC